MQMRYSAVLVLAIAILIFSLSISLSFAATQNTIISGKVRLVAHTNKEVSDALAKGCKIIREAKTLKALVCPKDVSASLGLQEDIRVFAMDSASNKQIGADLVHSAGINGTGIKIVVLDTGYNYNHPELSSSYLGGWDFVNNDTDPMDDNGHGSHVAGIITADGVVSNAKGVAPAAGIIAGKVLDASGSGYFSDVVSAIYWAVDDFNASAISMSLGTSYPYTYKGFCNNVLPDLTNATKYARERGVIVVVAAGNSGSLGVSIPGCINYSTTVGAVNATDNIASFSGIGNATDITAPGVNIYSSWLGTYYKTLSGTSMATPMVTGTVALIKAVRPEYTVAQVEDILFKTAKDLGRTGWDSSYGWGRVDAYAAYLSVKSELIVDTTPSIISNIQAKNISSTSAIISWTTDEQSNSTVRYGTTAPTSEASNSALVTSHSISLTALSKNTLYYYEVQSADASGNVAADNNNGTYYTFTTLSANMPPVANAGLDMTKSDADNNGVETMFLNGSASYDPDGTIAAYEWKEGATNISTAVSFAYNFSVGTHNIMLTVTDNEGATAADNVLVIVEANQPPIANAGPDKTAYVNDAISFDGSGSSDADGTIVSYNWGFGDGTSASGKTVTHSYSSAGNYTVILTITDNGGVSASDTALATVKEKPAEFLEFSDSFENGLTNWKQDAQNDWFVSTQRATDGRYSAEVDGSAINATITLAKAIDLSGKTEATLTFSWLIESGLDLGEYLCLDMHNGISWKQYKCLRGDIDTENKWYNESINLSGYLVNNFLIKFRAKMSLSNEDANVDNVKIISK